MSVNCMMHVQDWSINSQEYKSFDISAFTIKISMTEYHHCNKPSEPMVYSNTAVPLGEKWVRHIWSLVCFYTLLKHLWSYQIPINFWWILHTSKIASSGNPGNHQKTPSDLSCNCFEWHTCYCTLQPGKQNKNKNAVICKQVFSLRVPAL